VTCSGFFAKGFEELASMNFTVEDFYINNNKNVSSYSSGYTGLRSQSLVLDKE